MKRILEDRLYEKQTTWFNIKAQSEKVNAMIKSLPFQISGIPEFKVMLRTEMDKLINDVQNYPTMDGALFPLQKNKHKSRLRWRKRWRLV